MTLLEISNELVALRLLIEDSAGEDGELSPDSVAAIDALLAGIEKDQAGKADNYGALIRQWQLEASCHREEKERHAKNETALVSRAKWLMDRLKLHMETHGIKEIKTPRFKFLVCRNGGHQPIDVKVSPDRLPASLQKVAVTADIEAIRESIAAGTCGESFAVLLPRGTHLRLK